MFSGLWQWMNDRWPLSALFRLGLDEKIPGGASYAYTLGSTTLIVFILEIVSGIWQLFYYVPTTDHAYNSINYLRISVPFGWLVHGIHYWGAQAMVILVLLHMTRVFVWGAYKRPRELTWLLGATLLLLILGMSFTGALLPWDEKGYFAAEVGTSIASTAPILGDWVKRIMRGGEAMGQLTLSRFFVLHVAIIPGVLVALIGLHVIAFRNFGSVGPWKEARRQRSGRFWPDQIFKDVVVGLLVVFVLIALAVYARAPITGPADPVDTSYQPKPEWNFLFLYQALKVFKGSWEPVGTIGLPLVGVLILFLIPFIDRRRERNPFRRPLAMAFLLFAGVAVIGLTMMGYSSHPGGRQPPSSSLAPPTAQLSASAQEGAKLFDSIGCITCHSIYGSGGTVGPDLMHEARRGHTKNWIVTQIRDPKKHDPKTIMPAFSRMNEQQINDLADYLLSLGVGGFPKATQAAGAPAGAPKPQSAATTRTGTAATTAALSPSGPPGPAATTIGDPKHGAVLFRQKCESCHGIKGTGNVPNPGSDDGTVPPLNPIDRTLFNPDAQVFAENIDHYIQHGSRPDGPNPDFEMADFGDSHTLTQPQIAELEAYVLHLNGVDRAQLRHAGLPPRQFFLLTVAVFALTGLGLGLAWVRVRR